MAETENLCEYCTAIDFEQLRLPSSKDVEKLNKGQPIEGIFPFIDYDHVKEDRPHWSLGPQSRIQSSAATCPFCREVSLVLETSGVRVKAPTVFEKDPICDVYFTKAGGVHAPPGVTWKRYGPLKTLLREFARKVWWKHRHLLYKWLPKISPPSAKSNGIPYPRISLRWTVPKEQPMSSLTRYPEYEGVIELFECFQSIEIGMNERGGLFSGRERPALIDLELPRRWLRDCLDNDNDWCAPKPKGEGVRTSVFRLIDTKTTSIIEFDQHRLGDAPYVALSYVWGTTQQAMLKRENLRQLKLPGSLQGVTSQTITDATAFTSGMGYRYLWVDALCIIQNDDADKMSQLQIMGDIYKNAVFTIVAAAGEGSGSGLAGVRTPRTAIQRKVQVKPAGPQEMPLWLISTVMPHTVPSLGSCISDHPWPTRGWTLQEIALSRRVFIFTAEQLLWSCMRCGRWEETDTETKLASLSWDATNGIHRSLRFRLNHQQGFTSRDVRGNFRFLVADFMKRKLSLDGDAHDAVSAILREYTEMTGEQFLWGLPVSREQFSFALHWQAYGPLVRRECLTTLPTTSLKVKVPFPSWSWLGWKGDIHLFVPASKLEIRPYVLRNTPVRLVEIHEIPEDNMSRATPSSANGRGITSALPTQSYPNAFESLTLDTIYKTLSPDITPERLSRTPDDQLLFFWCERAHLYLEKPSHNEFYIQVHNEEGLTQFLIMQLSVLDELDGNWEKSNSSGRERMKAEFIAISSHPKPSESRSSRKELDMQFVLLLIKRRDGISYRVTTIPTVPMQRWLKFKRERILVALG